MNKIKRMSVGCGPDQLFAREFHYDIPLYQRDYAWEKEHVRALVDDIFYANRDENEEYFLGSLIVNRLGCRYEVIDGQQRLTTLYLILCALKHRGIEIGRLSKDSLTYQCRERSVTILQQLWANPDAEVDEDSNIYERFKEIKQLIDKIAERPREEIIKKVENTKIFRIEVPEGCDLNLYYERMNTRGEQLEQVDIVKANLMSFIKGKKKRACFEKIWLACSQMDTYVQMGIKDTGLRESLFGADWTELNVEYLKNLFTDEAEKSEALTDNSESYSFEGVISSPTRKDSNEQQQGILERPNKRFESVISFPVFLNHALKIFTRDNLAGDGYGSLDALGLKKNFKGAVDSCEDKIKKEQFAIGFIQCLLKLRFLFDQYIIKRDFYSDERAIIDEHGGVWSLKKLKAAKQKKKNQKTPSYVNSVSEKEVQEKAIKIQSCLRVTYTSPRFMHWITVVLGFLYISKYVEDNPIDLEEVTETAISYAAEKVKESFLDKANFYLGLATPHIVFNFLDFILWEKQFVDCNWKDFDFKFRNSIEHWYPQHLDPEADAWNRLEKELHLQSFGNLALTTTNTNSKFSNSIPSEKARGYTNLISTGSLKLQCMAKITRTKGWTAETCQEHQAQMINFLKEKCDQVT